MKYEKRSFKLVLFLVMIGILLSCSAEKNIYAKTKKVKWTATIAKKKYDYTGKKIKPKVIVKYKGKKLPKKNYTVKYPKYPVDDGKYKIKVTLKGKYKGKKLKGTKIIKYKIYDPDLYYHPEEEKKNPDDVLVEKNVKGMTIAYNKGKFPFGRSIQTDKESGAKVEYAQCYFPVFIKQKINQDFVVHTEYNGSCGFNNFSNKQYIPNRKDAQVITKVSAYYYYEDDVTKPYDELQQSLYNKGYIGDVMINVSCLLNKEQSIDLYFGDEKVVTIKSDKFSNLDEFDYSYYRYYEFWLVDSYDFSSENKLKNILKEVSTCSPNMTDYDIYTALEYWITCHKYSEYTCWGALVVAEAMTELGYPYVSLACSYSDGNGWFYNDYSRYYSMKSKLENNNYLSLGHMITLIYLEKGKFTYCEVQGRADEGTTFVFNPAGWTRQENGINAALWDGAEKFPLNEYNTINELMKGDYEIDPYQYDAFDWRTWRNYL